MINKTHSKQRRRTGSTTRRRTATTGSVPPQWICGCISAAYMASSALAFVTCIPRVDSTTMSMVMFMYANEVGAKIAFDDGTLLRPSTR